MTRDTELFIINALRESTTRWPGRTQCLNRFREARLEGQTAKGKPIYKFYWQCQGCKDWFRDVKQLEVDHISEVGPFNGDFDQFVRRLFCDQSNLVPLCLMCHKRKTAAFTSALNRYQRKPISAVTSKNNKKD